MLYATRRGLKEGLASVTQGGWSGCLRWVAASVARCKQLVGMLRHAARGGTICWLPARSGHLSGVLSAPPPTLEQTQRDRAGMEQLGAQIAQVKARLQERIAHVVRKQVRGKHFGCSSCGSDASTRSTG